MRLNVCLRWYYLEHIRHMLFDSQHIVCALDHFTDYTHNRYTTSIYNQLGESPNRTKKTALETLSSTSRLVLFYTLFFLFFFMNNKDSLNRWKWYVGGLCLTVR